MELELIEYNLGYIFNCCFRDIENLHLIYDDCILFFETQIINNELVNTNKYYSYFLGLYFQYEEYYCQPDIYYIISAKMGNYQALCHLLNFYRPRQKYNLFKKYVILFHNKYPESLIGLIYTIYKDYNYKYI